MGTDGSCSSDGQVTQNISPPMPHPLCFSPSAPTTLQPTAMPSITAPPRHALSRSPMLHCPHSTASSHPKVLPNAPSSQRTNLPLHFSPYRHCALPPAAGAPPHCISPPAYNIRPHKRRHQASHAPHPPPSCVAIPTVTHHPHDYQHAAGYHRGHQAGHHSRTPHHRRVPQLAKGSAGSHDSCIQEWVRAQHQGATVSHHPHSPLSPAA
jgi:hypothetical protein